MDKTYEATEHRKGQHLLNEERHEIEVRLKDGWTIYRIARHLGRPYNTIKNEVSRGLVTMYHGKHSRYKAEAGKAVYLKNRKECRRKIRILETSEFVRFVVERFRSSERWSLDASVGYAKSNKLFARNEMVCTRTLYHYVDLGLLPIRNIDLPEKLRRKTKSRKVRQNKRILGTSIEERPESINSRKEFGHWELDSVLGKKTGNEPCIITLTERKTRMCFWLKVKDHSAEAAKDILKMMFLKFGDHCHEVFQTITTDNGSEFVLLRELEDRKCKFYFTHPYTSYEKGTNECHNRMLRRFIPKGKTIADYTADDICFFADCINGLPRKILNYSTPEKQFEAQLDIIYTG